LVDFNALLISETLLAHGLVDILGFDVFWQGTKRTLAEEKIDIL
jgi:hypothetical protein